MRFDCLTAYNMTCCAGSDAKIRNPSYHGRQPDGLASGRRGSSEDLGIEVPIDLRPIQGSECRDWHRNITS